MSEPKLALPMVIEMTAGEQRKLQALATKLRLSPEAILVSALNQMHDAKVRAGALAPMK